MRGQRGADRRETGKQRDRVVAIAKNPAQAQDIAAQRIGGEVFAGTCRHREGGEPQIKAAVEIGGGEGVYFFRQEKRHAVEARRLDPRLRRKDAATP